jgi:thiamine transport system substrate-binding protein
MRRLVVLVVAMCAAAAACSSGSGNSSTAAKGLKTVTLLSHDAFAASPDVLAAFTKQTGYTIKFVKPGDAGVAVNQAILTKNHPVADAFFGVDNTFLSRALDAGIFVPYTAKGSERLKGGLETDPQHRITPIDQGDVCINDDLTWFGKNGHPPVPTTLASLTDPRYKNLTVVENPATSSPGLAFLLTTVAAQGNNGWQDYWRALKANGVRVVNDWTQAYENDFTVGGGNGDRPIVVSYGSSPPADVVGSTPHRDVPRVGVVDTTCFRQYEYAGVLKGAKNPAGARALVDFMISAQFQSDMPLNMYVNPVVNDAVVDPVYARWTVIPAKPYTIDAKTIGANRDAWIKQWTDIMGQ